MQNIAVTNEKGVVRFMSLYGFVEAKKIYPIFLFIQRKMNNWVIILGTGKA